MRETVNDTCLDQCQDIGEIGISYAKIAVMTQGNSTIFYLARETQERQGVAIKRM